MRDERQPQTMEGACPSVYQMDAVRLFGVRSDLSAHLLHCPRCAAMVRDLSEAEAAFSVHVLPRTVDVVIERAMSEQKTASRIGFRRLISFAAAAMLAAVIGFVFWARPNVESPSGGVYIGDKGAVGLEVWCKRKETVFRVHQGAKLRADDRIRFVPRFVSDKPLYMMVVSVDGNGTVSRYFPADEEAAARVTQSGAPLPGSTILDDASGPERVWLLSSTEKFHFREVEEAVFAEWKRNGGADRMGAIPFASDQASLFFVKERTE